MLEITGLLTWIVFGLLAGTTATLLDDSFDGKGAISSVLLGIMGAVVGGVLSNIILGVSITGFNLESFAIAVIGTLLILSIQKLVGKEKHIKTRLIR